MPWHKLRSSHSIAENRPGFDQAWSLLVNESFLNPAKEIALQLAGTLPAIRGSTPLAGVAAYRFACQLNENAKYPGIHGVLPEANHNQVVAFDGPFAPGREPHPPAPAGGPGSGGARAGMPLRLVMLVDAPEHPQVTKPREVSAVLAP
jgi:glucose/mannose-6-phosphate isomerase